MRRKRRMMIVRRWGRGRRLQRKAARTSFPFFKIKMKAHPGRMRWIYSGLISDVKLLSW